MDQDQEKRSLLFALPTELLVYIISFVSSLRDRIKLRYVSKWMKHMVEETPSLWKEFVWPYYDRREEYRVKEVLKACGQHIRELSFPYCRVPSTVIEMLPFCSKVQYLSLPLTRLDNELVTKALQLVHYLQTLDLKSVELNSFCQGDFEQLLTIVMHLKELIVNVDCNGCLISYLRVWRGASCKPSNLNIFCTTLYFSATQFSSFTPPSPNVSVRMYGNCGKANSRFLPPIPFFQMHFGKSGQLTTPRVKLSDFGILGLEEDEAVMNDCWYGGRRVCLVKYQNQHIAKLFMWPRTTEFCNLTYATHFSFAFCHSLCSGHLEQLAMACPNLQRLTLHGCERCLESLQGLKAIASHCRYLQGLNLLNIHVSKVEDQILLWEILSKMKLTHLAVGCCLLRPEYVKKEKLICLYQNCWALRAIQYHSCNSCGDFTVEDALLVSYFPSMDYWYSMSSQMLSTVVQDIIGNCKSLKYASFIDSPLLLPKLDNNNLQQFCIDSSLTVVPDDFMTSVSAHGRLIHVVLRVWSIAAMDLTSLIRNSPNLITLDVHTNLVRQLCGSLQEFNVSLRKVCNKTCGHYLVQYSNAYSDPIELKMLHEQGTDLLPLWRWR